MKRQNTRNEVRIMYTTVGPLTYELSRKSVKNVNLRIDREGRIKVSADYRVPISFIEDFIREKEDYIRKAAEKMLKRKEEKESGEPGWKNGKRVSVLGNSYILAIREGKKEGIDLEAPYLYLTVKPGAVESRKEVIWQSWQKKLAHEILEERMNLMEQRVACYGIVCREMHIRRMTSRWGSCQPSKEKITLNTRLVEAPLKAIDYVVLHELAHMKYPHHQKSFYDFIAHFMPDWRERKELLKGIM
ncbi:MAG: M48 family metallopeptidase [Lachnospiraceae bacterium]